MMSTYRPDLLERELAPSYAQPVSFGKNVRIRRIKLGLQQKELARMLSVSQGTLSGWENDRRGLPEGPTLIRFAKALQCSVEQLIVGVDDEYDGLLKRNDLPDHAGVPSSSPTPLVVGDPDVPASVEARVRELEARLGFYETFVRQMHEAAEQLHTLTTAGIERLEEFGTSADRTDPAPAAHTAARRRGGRGVR